MAHPDYRSHKPATLIVLLLNQSSSMGDPSAEGASSVWEIVARAVNRWLQQLVSKVAVPPAITDIAEVALIGFRTDETGTPMIEPALSGTLRKEAIVSVGDLAALAVDGPPGSEPAKTTPYISEYLTAGKGLGGGRPLCAALDRVFEIVESWVARHPEDLPPIVITISDGEATDGDPAMPAAALRELRTKHGHVLLVNFLVLHNFGRAVFFPQSAEPLPDAWIRNTFRTSSELPESFMMRARASGVSNSARGLALLHREADLYCLLEFVSVLSFGPHDKSPEYPPAKAAARPYLDENVQFTTYYPRHVVPDNFHTVLAFAHLDELPPDADRDQLHPVVEVRRQAGDILGEKLAAYRNTTQESRHAVPREGELTLALEIEGFRCNPPRQTIFWVEPVHRVEFRIKAPASLEGKTCRGRLSVLLGDILLADVTLRIEVTSSADEKGRAPVERSDVRPYRKIFASYSRRDMNIVQQFERYAQAMGDRYLRDLVDLRSGEKWNDGLKRMIEEADVFQLFWSHNSMGSQFVRDEWEYALSLERPNFIRPTYWEEPFPERPPELPPTVLRDLHFQFLGHSKDAVDDTDESAEYFEEEYAAEGGEFDIDSQALDDNSEFDRAPEAIVPAKKPGGGVVEFSLKDDVQPNETGAFDADEVPNLAADDRDDRPSAPEGPVFGETFECDDESMPPMPSTRSIRRPAKDDPGDAAASSRRPRPSRAPRMADESEDESQVTTTKIMLFILIAILVIGGIILTAYVMSDKGDTGDSAPDNVLLHRRSGERAVT